LGNNLRVRLNRFLPAFLKKKSTTFLDIEGGRYPKDLVMYAFAFFFCVVIGSIVSYKVFCRMR